MNFDKVREKMSSALAERVFTASVLFVALGDDILIHEPQGLLATGGAGPVTLDTLFDQASLTKILATTPLWMLLAHQVPGILDCPISHWIPGVPGDKAAITPRHLLAHASGLPAWRPYYLTRLGKLPWEKAIARILAEPLVFPPGTGCLYSDLGFMVLKWIAQLESGEDFARSVSGRIYRPLRLNEDLMFRPVGQEQRTAATRVGDVPGLVNDLNARALGGVSGHAGLFGTARAAGMLAREILKSLNSSQGFFDRATARTFCSRAGFTRESTRGLGFDTPSEINAPCGKLMSKNALGHTGFTGVSLWLDPPPELVVVLFTNRVIMGESDTRIKGFRPVIHDEILAAIL